MGHNMSRRFYRLTEAADGPLAEVGAKARNLGRLKQAGFQVPDGLVVPPSLAEADIEQILEQVGDGPFVVRSSGVSEDSAESSMAGQYESILEVERSSIPAAVAKVRRSARHEEGAIPVLVQAMIAPTCAGAAFTADPITGDRDTIVVTATRGLADRLLSGEVAGDEWQVHNGKARPVRRPEEVLDKKLVRRVARTATEIAQKLGTPQDVEWAWDGDDLWVVQARPMTGLPDEVDWEPPAPGIYHRSLRFGEWIPQPVTPLFESWLLPRMEGRLHERLHELIGQVFPEPHHVVVNGWYYYSLNWLPLPGVALTRNFINILRRVLEVGWRQAAPMFPQTVRFGYQEREDEWREEILPAYRSAVTRAEGEVERADVPELIDIVDELATEAGSYFTSIATVAGSAYKFESQLAQFWNKHLKEKLGVSHMVVLQGFEMPDEIHETPRLETLDWSVPPAKPSAGPADIGDLKARRSEVEQDAEQVLAGSPRRLRKFRRLLEEAQHLVPIREEQLSLFSLPWPVMRRAVRRIGETLVDASVIESVHDVFYLTREEVSSLLTKPADMNDDVASRREVRQRATKLAAPIWVGKVPRIVKFVFSYSNKAMGGVRSDEAIVHGVPASPGRASGRVRVVRDSSQFDDFEDGEILVAPLTAPAWTGLFGRAAAVVTDVGSALAHASIIAREYGIPAVVGCGDATSRLKDGQAVTVDGSTGNVELLQAETH